VTRRWKRSIIIPTPTRALAQQSTETVGLVVGDVSDPFFGAMVKAVEQVAYNTGNFLLIGNGYHSIKKSARRLSS
jgi:LacI family transcriptional regulator